VTRGAVALAASSYTHALDATLHLTPQIQLQCACMWKQRVERVRHCLMRGTLLCLPVQHVHNESNHTAHVHRAARAWLSMVLNSGFAATARTAAASPLR